MWDLLLAVFMIVKMIAMVGLALVIAVVLAIVWSYLKEEFFVFLKKLENRRIEKAAKKDLDEKSWEDFFFKELPKGFDNTGEIIQPHALPKGDSDDRGVGQESK